VIGATHPDDNEERAAERERWCKARAAAHFGKDN